MPRAYDVITEEFYQGLRFIKGKHSFDVRACYSCGMSGHRSGSGRRCHAAQKIISFMEFHQDRQDRNHRRFKRRSDPLSSENRKPRFLATKRRRS